MNAHDPHLHTGGPGHHPHGPIVRIVHGDPSAEEIAALMAVLVAASGAGQEPEPSAEGSQWAPPARLMRAPSWPTGWWASALPR